ncbi:MAG TPA: TIM-barrel domain-containing protein [Roseiflexaceae bacterium]|nr:TIM-barrel domain-containing protein [Roseiflexaceae bacterium]
MTDAFDTKRMQRPGALVRSWWQGRTIIFDYGGARIAIAPLAADLLRIRLAPRGDFAPRRSWAVTPPDEAFPQVDFTVDETEAALSLTTAQLVVLVARHGGGITIRERAEGQTVLADGPDGGPAWDPAGSAKTWARQMPEGEHYYGLGERTGLLDKRGRRYTCWTTDEYEHQGPETDALYQAIPFLLALNTAGRSYGLFLNNTYRSVFDMRDIEHERYQIGVAGGELDYYVIYGPEPARVIERYTELTGRMPLPPRWALGYHQSRWSYDSADCVRDIAAEFRQRGIPADAINLDIDHMDGYRIFTWDRARFPEPAALSAELGAQGFKVTAIVDAGVKVQPDGSYPVYAEGRARGYFIKRSRAAGAEEFTCYVWPGLCAFPDFMRQDVREWWGEWYATLLDCGISGFVNDMNEPAMHDKPFDHPASASTEPPPDTPQGLPDEPTTHAEARNMYAYLEDQATYAALRRLRPQERPFLLSRAGYAGVQRYAGVWAGDNASFWEHLEMSLPELLNLGLSGIAFCGTDIGGFFENGSPELYARWMQLGSLYPFARSNSAKGTSHNAPWAWGEQVEAICRRALELRYRLLPYFYTLFDEAARTGAPVLRPVFYHYPADPATHQLHDQALLGRDLLLAPVLRPGKVCREVYLPEGAWYDLRSERRLNGPGHVLADARLDMPIPLYARAGAIIPSGPPMQWSDQRPLDRLTLDIYPDAQGYAEGRLYEDDGCSFAYEQGHSCQSRYRCEVDLRGGKGILSAQRAGAYAPADRAVDIHLHHADGITQAELPADNGEWRIELAL